MADEDFLIADGLDAAFLGIGRRCGQPDLAVYSIPKAIEILVDRDGIDDQEAREYLEFNTIGAWVGSRTPVWVEAMTLDEARME
jgi:hypothetical protein